MSKSQFNFNDSNSDRINVAVVCLLLQQALVLSPISAPEVQQNLEERLCILANIDPCDLHREQFHRGVTAIGVDHFAWRTLTLQVLEDLLRENNGLVLIDPSDRQVLDAETLGPASTSIVNKAFKRKTTRPSVRTAANDNAASNLVGRSIILTCPAVSSSADAEVVVGRARSLSRRAWRVLILCDDASTLCHRHPDRIDQVLQTRGVMPWVLKRICQPGTFENFCCNMGFLGLITPDYLQKAWQPGITTAALKILLEEAMFPQNDDFPYET